jgi:hypothetical protein
MSTSAQATSHQIVTPLEQLYQERSLIPFTAGRNIPLQRQYLYIICRGIVQLILTGQQP